MIALNLRPSLELTDETFWQICQNNPELRLEKTAQGKLVAMSPTGSESGYRNADLLGQLWQWNRQKGLGIVFDSSSGFALPNGAIRSPNVAWIERSRWENLTAEQRQKFAPLCPDFVIELKSPSDELAPLQVKLEEYMANGAQLGWLIDPKNKQVHCYYPGQAPQIVEHPSQLSAAPQLPGLILDFQVIWY